MHDIKRFSNIERASVISRGFGVERAFGRIVRASVVSLRPFRTFVTAALISGKSILRQAENWPEATHNCACINFVVITHVTSGIATPGVQDGAKRCREPGTAYGRYLLRIRNGSSLIVRNIFLASKRRLLVALR